MTLLSKFSDDNIYKVLVSLRLKTLDKRSKLHANREMSTHPKTEFASKRAYVGDTELSRLMPPRRTWVSPGLDQRKQLRSSKERVKFALNSTYNKTKQSLDQPGFDVPKWFREFQYFCEYIRYKLSVIDQEGFGRPQIVAVAKKKPNKHGQIECRPIAVYGLEDRVIIGLTAKYFVNILDQLFLPNSFAFRKTTRESRITHHTAFQKVIDYKSVRKKQDLYVAEYDIRKFYDCVNHDVILDKLATLQIELDKMSLSIEQGALDVLTAYLRSYSFNTDVLPLNDDPNWFERRKIKKGHFAWEKVTLEKEFGYDFSSSDVRIGVPQGGALSCIISNVILHFADQAVLSGSSDELLYLRYCDDMILMHTDQHLCEFHLNKYLQVIKNCKLLAHQPLEKINSQAYSKHHWELKAKPIYQWGQSAKNANTKVPWVGFVGYQIRYDLKIRVRKSSLEKQKNKLKEEYKRILDTIDYDPVNGAAEHAIRSNSKAIISAFKTRLISLSIGKPSPKDFSIGNYEMCWANGFQLLTSNDIVQSQLKELDRMRTYQYYKIEKVIPKVNKERSAVANTQKRFKKIYYGTPFSYYSILNK